MPDGMLPSSQPKLPVGSGRSALAGTTAGVSPTPPRAAAARAHTTKLSTTTSPRSRRLLEPAGPIASSSGGTSSGGVSNPAVDGGGERWRTVEEEKPPPPPIVAGQVAVLDHKARFETTISGFCWAECETRPPPTACVVQCSSTLRRLGCSTASSPLALPHVHSYEVELAAIAGCYASEVFVTPEARPCFHPSRSAAFSTPTSTAGLHPPPPPHVTLSRAARA